MANALETLRSSFLRSPRTSVTVDALPPKLRVYLADFSDALKVEARRLVVGGVPYFELLRTHQWGNPADSDDGLDEAEDARDLAGGFVTGTIVDGEGTEIVELDFVAGVATFLATPEERAHNARLSRFAQSFFTEARLESGLAEATAELPPAVAREPGAKGYRFEFEGRTYFAQAYREGGVYEVLVYDAGGRGLGGCYGVGRQDLELEEVEATLPLAAGPMPAQAAASGHDSFEVRAGPKVVF